MSTTPNGKPVLQARGLVKRYGHVVALDGADFDLFPGEILAVKILVHPRHDPQQRALARAVASQDADLRPRIKRQPNILQHLPLAVLFEKALDRKNVLPRHVWILRWSAALRRLEPRTKHQ